ncbi:MAG: hypothetical protein KC620_26530, partial [Myxococcales bacterium]|nr:hypothetical protein [Myxococcales bacterium]
MRAALLTLAFLGCECGEAVYRDTPYRAELHTTGLGPLDHQLLRGDVAYTIDHTLTAHLEVTAHRDGQSLRLDLHHAL